jgi:anaerobic magnesium-protoporphyrin IX monomethyl ester cyclase
MVPDVALLVPFQPHDAGWIDPRARRFHNPAVTVAIEARHRLEALVGLRLRDVGDLPDSFERDTLQSAFRSLTAVSLATAFERGGLQWVAIDPGERGFRFWRRRVAELRARRPRLVAITTTFMTDASYAGALCAMVRDLLPEATLAVGGYLYASDVRGFLALDADVFCVGEGETRIVDVAKAVRDGGSLEGIPGLYCRGRGGELRFTGAAEPLHMDALPAPDWSLSARIDPPVDVREEAVDYHVETQRGCVFKCEFCTFRTLAAPAELSVLAAAENILAAARHGRGRIWIVDATATYPRDRWRAILEELIARGGSPLPLRVFARVSDLDDAVCDLMARAGVKHVYIGQETGSQRLLNAMRKGTRVDQVEPALRALQRHGLLATISLFHGFPGEDTDTLRETREMLLGLDEGGDGVPAAVAARLEVFDLQDFAGVRVREDLRDCARFDYETLPMTATQAAHAVLRTCVAASRAPRAPVTGFGVVPTPEALVWMGMFERDLGGAFHWAKAVDRGLSLLVEAALEGGRPDPDELRRVADVIAAGFVSGRPAPRLVRTAEAARNRLVSRLLWEWRREARAGVGPLTRLHLGHATFAATGSLVEASRAALLGAFPRLGMRAGAPRDAPAADLIALGAASGRRKRVARA